MAFKKSMDPNKLARSSTLDLIRKDYYATVGAVISVMAATPDYENLSFQQVSNLVLEPLARGRLLVSSPRTKVARDVLHAGISGIVFSACVSASVDRKIKDLIDQNTFPVILQPEEWVSGNINWVLDIIAPGPAHLASTMSSFKRKLNDENLQVHPRIIRRLGMESAKEFVISSLISKKIH